MKKSKILVLLLIFILALSAFACSSGVKVDDFSVASKSDSIEGSQGGEGEGSTGSSASTGSSVTPSKDKAYAITVGTFEHGSVTVEGEIKSAKKGEQVVFIVTADSGYELAWIKINDGNDLKSKVVSGKLTVTMYEMDVKVTAQFSEASKINNSSYAPVQDENALENDLFSAIRETTQNGQFTLSAYNDIRYGNTVNVTATPNSGYKVKEVVVTTRENNAKTITVHGNNNDWAFVMPKANVKVEVTFEKELYLVSVATVEGVTVTLNKTYAYYGEEVLVSNVSLDDGYSLLRLEVNGAVVTDNKFTMPAANVTVKAFLEKEKYTITVNDVANGTVTIDGGLSHEFGETVAINLDPNDNYQLDTVIVITESGESVTVTDLTFVMPTENVEVTVTFKEAEATYSVTVNEAENGTVYADKTQAVFGEKVTLNITPDGKYEIDTITVKGASAVQVTNNSFAMPNSDVVVTVTFVKKSYTVTAVSPNGTTDLQASYKWGEKVAFTVTASDNYEVASVTIKYEGHSLETLTKLSTGYEFTMPEADVTITVNYTLKKYVLTIDSNITNGSVTLANTGTEFTEGDLISVLAEPSNGYYLKSLTYNDIDITATKQFTMPGSSVTIKAEFEKKSYSLSISVTNGEASGSVTTDTTSPLYDDSITLTVTPGSGFTLSKLSVDGVDVTSQVVDGQYVFNMPAKSVTVVAIFESRAFTITVTQPSEGGEISSSVASARYNAEVTLSIELGRGYTLVGFVVMRDGTAVTLNKVSDTSYKFNMPNGDVTVTAETEKVDYALSATVSGGVGGTVTIDGGKTTATYGEEVTLTIAPTRGYRLKTISGNDGAITCTKVNDTSYKFTMTDATVAITAEFEKIPYNIDSTVSGGVGGTVTVQETAVFGTVVTVTLSPATGCRLKTITVNDGDVTSTKVDDTTYTFTMPTSDVTVEVEYEKIPYTLTLNVGDNGTANITDNKTSATYGETITVTVTPEADFILSGISVNSGAVTVTSVNATTYTFTMPNGNVTVNVTFAHEPYSITYGTVVGGTVTVAETAIEGTEVTVTLTPSIGYHVDGISVNSGAVTVTTVNTTTYKFTMPASDVTIAVTFAQTDYTVTVTVSGGHGTATPDKMTANYGETITITTSPESGYIVDTIKLNGTAISGNTFTMPASNAQVVVTFKVDTVTVSTGTCVNGSVSATPNGTVQHGTSITLTATPNTGYELDYFTANGEKIVGGSTYTVTTDVEFKAVFKAKSYTLTVNHKCGDTVLQTETKTMTFGTSITVNAKTIEGYTATAASINVTMDAEGKTVVLSYTKNTYVLTVKHVIEGDGGDFATTQTYNVAYGETKTISPVSLTAYNGLIKASEGSKNITMGASNKTVTYSYSLDTTKKFTASSSTGAIPVITARTGFSVTYKITDDTAHSINDWCKIFSVKNANVFAGCLDYFDDNGTFVSNWFDGVHGHGNNEPYGTTYNWNAVIQEGAVYTISFNTDGSIDWYRNGLRVLYFNASTVNTGTTKISDFVTHLINGANTNGIAFADGTQSGTDNKTNVSDCSIGYPISKKTVTISYTSSDSSIKRGNNVYYMAPGFEYTFNTAMSGYTATRSTVVTGTGTANESYSVSYTRSATTATNVLSTPVLVARKNAYHSNGVFDDLVRVNGLSGDFFLEAKLTDVYQLHSGTDSYRVLLTGIYNGSNVRCYRFDRFSWNGVGTYGEWTQGASELGSSFTNVAQGRADILVTVSRKGTTLVICYKIYSYATSQTYYIDFLTESVTGAISFAFGGEDCTYTLEYIKLENATGTSVVNTNKLGTTVYNQGNTNGGWTDARVRTSFFALTGNFTLNINLYQLTYSAGLNYSDANWRTALLALYGWCDYGKNTVLRQDGNWWCSSGTDTGNNVTITSSDSALFTGNGTNSTGTKFADITRNAYITINVVGSNVGTSSGKVTVTYNFYSLNPTYKNTTCWLKYEVTGVTRSHNNGNSTSSIDVVVLCEQSSYVVYSYTLS